MPVAAFAFSPPLPPPPAGIIGRLLAHPGPTARGWLLLLRHLPGRLAEGLTGQLTAAVHRLDRPAVVVAAVVLLAAALLATVHARRRLAGRAADGPGGQYLELLPADLVDPAGAVLLWTTLHDLLRPRLARLVHGQPHLGFEYCWRAGQLHLGIWLPARVSTGLVAGMIDAAWPGTQIRVLPGPPGLLPAAGRLVAGRFRQTGPAAYPLTVDHPVDPLRPLLAAGARLDAGELALVQVLARPVTGRTTARGLAAAVARHTGRPASRAGRLLTALLPTPRPAGRAARPAGGDPRRTGQVTVMLTKAGEPGWLVELRYAAAAPRPDPAAASGLLARGRARRQARARLRGRAHALASSFAVYTSANTRLRRRRLPAPARSITGRRLRAGMWLSTSELAAVAHLPTDPVVIGLSRAAARTLPAPAAVHTPGAGPLVDLADQLDPPTDHPFGSR